MKNNKITIEEVREYWGEKNIPQQWYSKKKPFSLAWFNELAFKRFSKYYDYLPKDAEFKYHQGEDVLEVGCGIGTDLVEYAKYGAKVSGMDLGEDQVRITKLNFELHGLPYSEMKVGNAEKLPFADNSFDLVFCFGVLHHTPNTKKAIEEIFRVLKPDGTVLAMMYARGWKHYLKRCFIHGILKGRWIANGCNWQKVYNESSEVHGFTPKTAIHTKREIKKMFNKFPNLKLKKKRLGEFFEYKPYRTIMFPKFVRNFLYLLNLESLIGENWFIRAQKADFKKDAKLWDVIFNKY